VKKWKQMVLLEHSTNTEQKEGKKQKKTQKVEKSSPNSSLGSGGSLTILMQETPH
jgi:hypothetical protein